MSKAIERVARYVAMRDAKPLRHADDIIHAIHTGSEWEAELTLSDLREITAPDKTATGLIAQIAAIKTEDEEIADQSSYFHSDSTDWAAGRAEAFDDFIRKAREIIAFGGVVEERT
jgi:hypothetical protein